jgi:uncharacterized membrane protein YraQ (UPF0718 family)
MTRRQKLYLLLVIVLYLSGVIYAALKGLSIGSLYMYGLLQPPGLTGEEARMAEIATPVSWDLPRVAWYIYIKGAAVLVELFQYWVVGMLIAGALVVFVSWEKVKQRMGFGGFKANLLATTAGAVIPICSCGIVPVLAGMVQAGIPLAPTMAFLVAAPMLNVPTVFMTAGVLGWPLAVGRIIATFGIALAVGGALSWWQRKHPRLREFLKLHVPPRLSPELQQLAFKVAMAASSNPGEIRVKSLGEGAIAKLRLLEEAGVVEQQRDGSWKLVEVGGPQADSACFVLPTGGMGLAFAAKLRETVRTAYQLFIQLNGYLLAAVLIAGAIKVLIPTSVIVNWVGGKELNSVLVASAVALVAYVCTYVEVPTALALMSKGMGGGATLAYLLGGPGLSLPSIMMLSGVFRKKVLALYVGISFIGCVLAGWIYNLLV